MAENKTQPTGEDVAAFLASLENERRRDEGAELDALFQKVSGYQPVMWTGGIIGYGTYDYSYKSGRTGRFLATGFALRKAAISIYILPGYADFSQYLERLGPHKTGASCLYVTRLARIDTSVLEELVAAGLKNLAKNWPVLAT